MASPRKQSRLAPRRSTRNAGGSPVNYTDVPSKSVDKATLRSGNITKDKPSTSRKGRPPKKVSVAVIEEEEDSDEEVEDDEEEDDNDSSDDGEENITTKVVKEPPTSSANVFGQLSLGGVDKLIGRDAQLARLRDTIEHSLTTGTSSSCYLSGAPGTGKTASVQHALHLLTTKHKFDIVHINCMDVRTPSSLYKVVLNELGVDARGTRPEQRLRQALTKKGGNMIVIVLDEIDQLATSNYNVLYTAFGWPALSGSRVALIGIANSLDLTHRLLPKLKVNSASEPLLITFNAYSTQEVIDIVTARLMQSSTLLDAKAVELCARKVCAITGDIRKALGLCKLAIERMRKEAQSSTVNVRHVLQSVNDVYGSRTKQACAHLPLHSKLVLVAAIRMVQNGDALMLMKSLQSMYGRACALSKCDALPRSDVVSSCAILDDHGILTVDKRRQHVRLLVDVDTAQSVLNDECLVKQVLALL